MDVFTKYMRRLLQNNAAKIFSNKSIEPHGSYQVLTEEVQKVRKDPEQATRIAESLDSTEGDLFRDFDLSTFMAHFQLDPISKTALALACRLVNKSDLKTKGQC